MVSTPSFLSKTREPVGPDSPPEHLERLAELLFGLMGLRTCFAHLVIRTRSIDKKIQIAKDLFLSQQALDDVRERVHELLIPPAKLVFRNSTLPNILSETIEKLAVDLSVRQLGAYLVNYVCQLQLRCNSICDEPSFLVLERVEALLRKIVKKFDRIMVNITDLNRNVDPKVFQQWWGQLTWPVLPSQPSRDASLRIVHINEYPDYEDDYLPDIHFIIFNIEISATEVCAMTLLRFEPLPYAFEKILARQCWDEARHAGAMLECFRREGGEISDYPVHFNMWNSTLRCKSPEEILGIEQVAGEGFNIGSELKLAKRYYEQGHTMMARIYDTIRFDEIQHARNGLTWFRQLAGARADDLLLKLEAKVFIVDPVEGNVELRRYVGFSDLEIERQRKRFGQLK